MTVKKKKETLASYQRQMLKVNGYSVSIVAGGWDQLTISWSGL